MGKGVGEEDPSQCHGGSINWNLYKQQFGEIYLCPCDTSLRNLILYKYLHLCCISVEHLIFVLTIMLIRLFMVILF